jgi:outer membrane lipoprotein carrier protein
MSAVSRKLRNLCLLVAAVCFGSAVAAFAQPGAPNAKDLAQRVDRHYNNLHTLKAGFTENYQGLGIDRTESGTLLLLKPGRMRWDYSSPPGKMFVLDGKYAWSYIKGDAQAERIPVKDLNDLRSPLRYLLGHAQLGRELKDLKAAPASGGQFTLSGVPKGIESRVARLTLTVTADGIINGMTIVETDDAVTRFTFTDQQPNLPVPASTFHFTPPPGVQVQDSMQPI